MNICKWVNIKNEKYIKYHNEEWGSLNLNEEYLYEIIILEMFHSGLSWECVLNKRENFKKAYDNFDIKKVSKYDEKKIEELLKDEGIIRHRKKIEASIINSKIFLEIQKEFGSFSNYLKSFGFSEIIFEIGKVRSEVSDILAKDLKKRGMKFLGSVTIYSYLQAIGVINSHEKDCEKYSN